jgi:hypothetical protein
MRLFFVVLALFGSIAFGNDTMFTQPYVYTVTTTSTQLRPQNGLRTYLILINTGSQTVYVKFGSAQATTEGVPIPAGGSYEPNKAPANSVWADTATSTSTLTIIEGQ